MILHANCKINLGLDVLRRREDGYHELSTVMFPVAGPVRRGRRWRAPPRPAREFRAEGLAVDCAPGENICRQGVPADAGAALRRGRGGDPPRQAGALRRGARAGVRPTARRCCWLLDGLFRPWGCAEAELVARAAELGSDTAFFVRNTPQLMHREGRGDGAFRALHLAGMTLVVVKPGVGVSTREAYAGVRPRMCRRCRSRSVSRRPVAEWQGLVTNDFEAHIFAAHPAIRAAREQPACGRSGLRLDVGQRLGRVRAFRRCAKSREPAAADPLCLYVVVWVNCSAIPVLPPLPHLGFPLSRVVCPSELARV